MEHKDEDIISAHEKQKRIAKGQGGVILTQVEKDILENHVQLPEKKNAK